MISFGGDRTRRALFDEAVSEAQHRGLRFGHATVSVEYRRGDRSVDWQVFDNGRLVSWTTDAPSDGPRVVLEVQSSTLVVPCPATEGEAWRTALQWNCGPPGEELAPFHPYDLCNLLWARDLPRIDGATACWTAHVIGTPFGELPITYRVEDGLPVSVAPGTVDHPDAWFRVSAARSAMARAGHISAPEIIDRDADLGGDVDQLLLIAGLLELPTWLEARRITEARAATIALLSELSRDSRSFAELNQIAVAAGAPEAWAS